MIFYYLSTSEICSDKYVGHWWEGPFKRGINALYLCKYVKNLNIFCSLGQNVISCKRLLNLTNYLQCRFINFNWISVCFHVVQKDYSGHPTTGQIGRLIEFPSGYFVFKNVNVKVIVKYSFVLHTGFAGSPLLL